jgi:hypothetical protein
MRQRRKDGTGLTPPLEEELEQAIYRFFDEAFPAVERIRNAKT